MHTEFLWENVRERGHLDNLEEEHSLILKWTFKNLIRGPWNGMPGSG
jgi:hypothetical protein